MSIGIFLLLPVVVLPAVIVLFGLLLAPVESLWARALIMLIGLPAAIWFVLYVWFELIPRYRANHGGRGLTEGRDTE